MTTKDDGALHRRVERIDTKFEELRKRAEQVGMSMDMYNVSGCCAYQWGDVEKCLFYSRNRNDGTIYLTAELTCALSDLLTQLRNFVWSSGKNWDELIDIGIERWEERIEDFELRRGGLRPVR